MNKAQMKEKIDELEYALESGAKIRSQWVKHAMEKSALCVKKDKEIAILKQEKEQIESQISQGHTGCLEILKRANQLEKALGIAHAIICEQQVRVNDVAWNIIEEAITKTAI